MSLHRRRTGRIRDSAYNPADFAPNPRREVMGRCPPRGGFPEPRRDRHKTGCSSNVSRVALARALASAEHPRTYKR
jgi:hypothetical protein